MKIALIGEYVEGYEPHVQTDAAIRHSADHLKINAEANWVSTESPLLNNLEQFDAFLIGPGSPYKNMSRALDVIRFARESKVPCLGTCGGFQHMVLEYARNVLDIPDAQHAEYDPYASKAIVSKLVCSLAGREMKISFEPDSLVAKHYGSITATENYYCNFAVNPQYIEKLTEGGFRAVASDDEGECRVMEIADHPFFIGTLFVPQSKSTPENPHPVVNAFLVAANSLKH